MENQRNYIIMRWDMVMRGENGKEEISRNHTVEETARSPQGAWYASKVRLKNAVGAKNGKRSDQIDHIYVDFDMNLPDAFFEPQKPGRAR